MSRLTVILNGRPRELPLGATLEQAVTASGAPEPHRGVAAAVDGEVVPSGRWQSHRLEEGQRVEVVLAVQGG